MLNGLDNMTKKILSDAQSYADEVKKNSTVKIDQILADYNGQVDALSRQMAADAKAEAEMVITRARSQAALNERNELLRAKQEMIDETFAQACDNIVNMPRDEYVALLSKLVAKYQTGAAEIILNERDRDGIGADLLKKIVMNKLKNIDISLVKISKSCGNFKGGLILRQGDIDTNCTVEVLCEGLRHELEPHVIQQLQF